MEERNKNFNLIKSKFILKKIFNNIQNNNILKIIKYNKNLQNRLGFGIDDYKEYGKIIIELEFIRKRGYNLCDISNYFINSEKYDKSYFHIYFDNNKKEIKRNYITLFERIKKIKIIIDYNVESLDNLFLGCGNIRKISFSKFERKNITNMSCMFYGCSSLKELNLSNFKTDNVTNMSYMFYGCSSLKELNLSNFKTNKVTNMSYMFCGCSSLYKLDISNFNTDNLENKKGIFKSNPFFTESNFSCFINNKSSFKRYITYVKSVLKDIYYDINNKKKKGK